MFSTVARKQQNLKKNSHLNLQKIIVYEWLPKLIGKDLPPYKGKSFFPATLA